MDNNSLDNALRDFGRMVTVEMQAINEDMRSAIGSILAQNAARGLLISGASMSQVATTAAKTLPKRTQVALQLLARSFENHGVPVGPDNRHIAIETLEQFIENYRVQLRSIVEQTAPFRSNMPEAGRKQALGYIDLQASLEKERALAEISLLEAATIRAWGQKLNDRGDSK